MKRGFARLASLLPSVPGAGSNPARPDFFLNFLHHQRTESPAGLYHKGKIGMNRVNPLFLRTKKTEAYAMKNGDKVVWVSSNLKKYGVIVGVVPAGKLPDRERFPKLYSGAGVGLPRNHESYVVAVERGKTPGSSVRHYWPRVSAFR